MCPAELLRYPIDSYCLQRRHVPGLVVLPVRAYLTFKFPLPNVTNLRTHPPVQGSIILQRNPAATMLLMVHQQLRKSHYE